MRTIWGGIRVGVRTLLGSAALFALLVAIVLLPAGVVYGQNVYEGWVGSRYDLRRYGAALRYYLGEILSGNLAPGVRLDSDVLLAESRVTGMLLLGGAVLSLLLGAGAGCAMSRYSPPLLRRTAWLGSTLLLALPDLLLIVALQIGLRPSGIPVYGTVLGHITPAHYLLPTLSLSLLTLPYFARVVAGAIEEVGEEAYVVAARARGLPPVPLLLRYVGRNALVRIWPSLPVVTSILLSAAPVVEYMTDLPGLGRHLVSLRSGYGLALIMLPLLMVMLAVHNLLGAGAGWVNPVQGRAAPVRRTPGAPRHLPPGDLLSEARQGLQDLADWLLAAVRSLPGLPRRVGRALLGNPVLLAGTLLLCLLLGASLFADHLAAHPWHERQPVRIVAGMPVVPPYPPGPGNPLGSDDLGRDMWSRVLWGSRFGLIIALLAVPLRFALAVPLAYLATRRDGWLRRAVSGTASLFTSLPAFLIPYALVGGVNAIFTGRPFAGALVNILLLSLPGVPRLAETLCLAFAELESRPFVEGAVAAGAGRVRLLLRYLLPHAAPTMAVLFALEVPAVMTTTAFLGLRQTYVGGAVWDPEVRRILGPLMPDWGAMMPSPFKIMVAGEWWLWAPLAALFLAVLAFTLLGEGLRRQFAAPWRGA